MIAIVALNPHRELLLAGEFQEERFYWSVPRAAPEFANVALSQCGLEAGRWIPLGNLGPLDQGHEPLRLSLATELKIIPVAGAARPLAWVPLEAALSLVLDGLIAESVTVAAILALARHFGITGRLAVQAEDASVRADLDRFEREVGEVRARTDAALKEVHTILNSRIWRGLVGLAGILSPARNAPTCEPLLEIRCDQPKPDGIPRAGRILLAGWAVASDGVDRVEAILPGKEPLPVSYGIKRPDVARLFPAMPDSERCGFERYVDTSDLTAGLCDLRIRVVTKAHRSGEVVVPVLIGPARLRESDYDRWIEEFERREPARIALTLPVLASMPRISVITPVYRTNPEVLERAILSVKRQSYPYWELVLVDDGSNEPAIDRILARAPAADARIRVAVLPENRGIAAASNCALGMAEGEFVAQLDHDDELAADALFHVACAIHASPEADIFYSDEDHIDADGRRADPFFKPDWSPDLILSENYVCHLMVFRRSLALQVGGFRSVVDTAEDHDILLRMSLRSRGIVHIPQILYHWRTNVDPEVSSRASFAEDRSLAASRRCVEEHLGLAAAGARVENGRWPGRWRIRYAVPEPIGVRILIPTAGRLDRFRRCLESIASRTDYPLYSVAVADNSKSDDVAAVLKNWSAKNKRPACYLDLKHHVFNLAAMNNMLVRKALEDSKPGLLLFLHDDTAPLTPDWLTAMVELASRPEVGVTGAKLLYPDGRIQHAGVALGLFGVCGHPFRGYPDGERVYRDFPDVVRNVSAVTGACLMIRPELFLELGGFAADLPLALADIDLCLRVRGKGLRILYNPYAVLRHDETSRKGPEFPRAEERIFRARWSLDLGRDPFYNPNLTSAGEDYSFRRASAP